MLILVNLILIIKILIVSAVSKVFPDTLQHWHETTASFIKNQSLVVYQLNDLTQNVELLGSNLSSLQATVNSQRIYGQDEKIVADFGAKLEAVVADIDVMKEHYKRVVEVQKSFETDMDIIKESKLYTYTPIILMDLTILGQYKSIVYRSKLFFTSKLYKGC